MNARAFTLATLVLLAPATGAADDVPCSSFYKEQYVPLTSPKVYYTYQSVGQDSVSCAVSSWQDAQPEYRDPTKVSTQQVIEHVLRTKRNARIYAYDLMVTNPDDYTLEKMKVEYQGDSPPAVSTGSPRRPESGEPPMNIPKETAASVPPQSKPSTARSQPRKRKPAESSGMASIILNGLSQVASTYAASKGVYSPPVTVPTSQYASSRTHESSSRAESSLAAPLAPASCAAYRVKHWEPMWDSAAVEWQNKCSHPVAVRWCWVERGQSNCEIDNASSTLSPGETTMAVGPTGVRDPVAKYTVCDMSDDSKLCTR